MRNCPGRLVATPMGMVVALRSNHNHESYQKKMDAAGLYNEIKDLGSTTSENITSREVFDDCLAVRTTPEVQVFLSSAETCDVHRESTFRYVCKQYTLDFFRRTNVYILVYPVLVALH